MGANRGVKRPDVELGGTGWKKVSLPEAKRKEQKSRERGGEGGGQRAAVSYGCFPGAVRVGVDAERIHIRRVEYGANC